jgi:hypothetical protein
VACQEEGFVVAHLSTRREGSNKSGSEKIEKQNNSNNNSDGAEKKKEYLNQTERKEKNQLSWKV